MVNDVAGNVFSFTHTTYNKQTKKEKKNVTNTYQFTYHF